MLDVRFFHCYKIIKVIFMKNIHFKLLAALFLPRLDTYHTSLVFHKFYYLQLPINAKTMFIILSGSLQAK